MRRRSRSPRCIAAPATWAAETIGHATSGTFPTGGPASAAIGGGPGGPRGGGRSGLRRFRLGLRLAGAERVRHPRAALRRRRLAPARGRPPGSAPVAVQPAGLAGGGTSGGFGPGGGGAGPGGFGGGAAAGGMFGGDSASLQAAIRYAKAHGGGTVGVESQSSAAAAIVQSDANIAGLGGFSGRESTVSAAWLANEVSAGHLRWIVSDGDRGRPAPGRHAGPAVRLRSAPRQRRARRSP